MNQAEQLESTSGLIKFALVHTIIKAVILAGDEMQRVADAANEQTWVPDQPCPVPMSWQEMEEIVTRQKNQVQVWLSFANDFPPPEHILFDQEILKQAHMHLSCTQECIHGERPFREFADHVFQGSAYLKRFSQVLPLSDGYELRFIEPIMHNRLEIWREDVLLYTQEKANPSRKAAILAAVEWGRQAKQQELHDQTPGISPLLS